MVEHVVIDLILSRSQKVIYFLGAPVVLRFLNWELNALNTVRSQKQTR